MNQETKTINPTIINDEKVWFDISARTDVDFMSNLFWSRPQTQISDTTWPENQRTELEDIFTLEKYPYQSVYPIQFIVNERGYNVKTSDVASGFISSDTSKISGKKLKKYHEWLVNSTVQQENLDDIDKKIEELFDFAKEQEFEDGMESEFSRGLISFIKKHGNDAVKAMTPIFIHEEKNAEILSEALRWIGRLEHPSSDLYLNRLWLLERCLFCSSPQVRDGATLGLASLNDPHAIYYLKQTIKREKYSELREDMEQVLLQLEDTANATRFEKDQEKSVV